MNFKFMPELSWTWGNPFAWAIIILSTVAPLLWFWRKVGSEATKPRGPVVVHPSNTLNPLLFGI
jgi:hypothetical protein